MLILADGDDVSDLIPADPRIRLHICDPRPATIGEKRNLGCSMVTTDLICHWDDDDVSKPGRISDQVRRIEASRKPVTGYRSMRFTDGANWWLYSGAPGFALGTSLMYRRDWWAKHPFDAIQVGEDNKFGEVALLCGAIAVADAGDLMVQLVHPHNTSTKLTGMYPYQNIPSPVSLSGLI